MGESLGELGERGMWGHKLKKGFLFPLTVFNNGVQLIRLREINGFIIVILTAGLVWGAIIGVKMEDVTCTPIIAFSDYELLNEENINPIVRDYLELDVEVTAYTNGPESTGKSPGHPAYGITSSGRTAGWGTVAAPKEFPYGLEVDIPGYGKGVIQDRGGAIKWHPEKQKYILDIWMEDVQEARRWGRRNLRVKISRAGLSVEDENRILRRGQ